MGCLFPKADSPEAFWANIKNGVDAVTDIPPTHWRPEDYFNADPSSPDRTYARRGAFIDPIDFNPLEFGITPNNIEATDTTQLLGMYVAQQALRDAGYATSKEATDGRPFNRDRTSVILGVTGALELVIPLGARLGHPIWRKALKDAGVESTVAEDVVQRIADGYVPWQENSFPGLLGNVAAGRIANRFDVGGTNCVVDAACASSLGALHLAAMELYAGRSDMAITGGIDTFNDIFMYMCFSKTPALSPSGNSRPFSAVGDGTILGEGLGVIVLKRLSDARRDGDHIHAIIKSIGSSSDGKGNAVYAPSADGQVRCLLSAYRQADVAPRTIELVEAHGTGTKVGDAVEAQALTQVFRSDKSDGTWCALGSVKSMVGHTKAAAGIAGLIKAAMALDHKVLPPTIKVERPLEIIEPNKAPVYVNAESRPWLPRADHPRRAAVSAFGFGGSNFHCVLEESTTEKAQIDWNDHILILPFSANSIAELIRDLEKNGMGVSPEHASPENSHGRDAHATPWKTLRSDSHRLRAKFKADAPCRLILVLQKDTADLSKLIRTAIQTLKAQPDRRSWSTPDGVYFGSGKPTGKLAAIFPGQGSQYVGMLRDLACQFPQFLNTLTEADTAFGPTDHGQRLSDQIYPISVFTDDARAAGAQVLNNTRIAQPAIGAVSLGAWNILEHFGVQADAVAGHSFGELVALCAAGRINARSMHTLSCARGNAMAGEAGPSDRGAMLAVSAPLEDLSKLLKTEKLNLIIANKNAPTQAVLSGATDEIDRAALVLESKGLRCRRLAVSAAFHSPFVAEARKPFDTALKDIEILPGKIPVFANATADIYPTTAAAARALLSDQIVQPVEFVAEIAKMYDSGCRTFVEVGPGNKIAGLLRSILADREHDVISLDASSGKRPGLFDLACALSQLASLGHAVDLNRWDPTAARGLAPSAGKKPAMTIRLSGANYVKPRPSIPARPMPPKPTVLLPAEGSIRLNSTPPKSPTSPAPSPNVTHALETTQQSILALQKMQEQTAQLHQQYLQGQEQSQRTLHQLVDHQLRLLSTACGLAMPAGIPPNSPPQIQPPINSTLSPIRAPVFNAPPQSNGTNGHAKHEAPLVIRPLPTIQPISPAPVIAAPNPQNLTAQTTLLEVVADKTGYPIEMLELDMSLDSDLGIDSIKRVEILSALQMKLPQAPVVKPEDLGRLQTLRQIVAFLNSNSGLGVSPEHSIPENSHGQDAHAMATLTQTVLLEVVADKTGYPVEMLELDMSLDSDLGIDSIKRVEIFSALQTQLPEAPLVKPEDLGRLQTLRQIVQFLDLGPDVAAAKPVPAAPQPKITASKSASNGKSHPPVVPLDRQVLTLFPLDRAADRTHLALPKGAQVWVTDDGQGLAAQVCAALKARNLNPKIVALNAKSTDTTLSGLLILAPAEPTADFNKIAFKLIQRIGPALRKAAQNGGAFLASASRLDGAFALNGHAPGSALTGGLAGLIKTAALEWPEVACKSLDLPPEIETHGTALPLAEQIAEELLLKGPLEVGLSSTGRCEPRLVRSPLNGEVGHPTLVAGDVVVITGGARGVTAVVSIALARNYRCNLLLLGRSPAPTAEPHWLSGITGEAQIKKALSANEKGITPKVLEEKYRRAIINREMLDTLSQIQAAGAHATYQSLDIRDVAAVTKAVEQMRSQFGPVRGIVHGAGVLQDRLIEEKTDEQFDDVYSTKVDGLIALLNAVHPDDLKVIVAFSSSTGRFGRKGQVAYAAANEVLNKLAQQEARRRPACRVLSINWGPWEGGMVTPGLRRIFENEGVGLIPLQAGADYLLREMATPAGGPVEIVILGPSAVRPSNGSLTNAPDASLAVAFEREVSIKTVPVLQSHVIKGHAVVPMALVLEWLADGAMHENPGLQFHGVDDLRIFKGLILDPHASIKIQILAGPAQTQNDTKIIPVELRTGPTLHARATIVLASSLPKAEPAHEKLTNLNPYSFANEDIYPSARLFHGKALQAIQSIEGCSTEGIVAQVAAAPLPPEWMTQPMRSAWLSDPLSIDAAFQLMILWCFETRAVGSLPTRLSHYRQYRRSFPATGVTVVIRAAAIDEHTAGAEIEFLDSTGALVARIDGYQCVMDPTLLESFSGNQLET